MSAAPDSRAAPAARGSSPCALRAALVLAALALGCALHPAPAPIFRIAVVDAESGRGIPAVELRTTDARSFVSDSAGIIALGDPVLMNRAVFFQVASFGYRFDQESHGVPGVTLEVAPGRSARLSLQRENVAQRLYRVTGSGIYRDSLLTGDPLPFEPSAPDLIAAGTDSALTTVYRDELFWVFGDTSVLSRPLGILRATAATSLLPGRGGVDPEIGVDLRYFHHRAEPRAMVEDRHPMIWLSALRATHDAGGTERLFASYRKVIESMQTIERGLVEFDNRFAVFRIVSAYPAEAPIVPDGHALRYREGGTAYLQYDMDVRGRDDAESVRDLSSYEAFTPTRPGARLADGAAALERDARGRLRWAWKRNAPPIPYAAWDELEASGAVAARERPYRMIDVETGETIVPHNGSLQWNEYRRRWILIRSEWGGASSRLGEVYYFEGDTPLGPWAYGRKIITHSRRAMNLGQSVHETYSFYNPMQHPEFDRDGGREIFLEGTLSTLFSEPAAAPLPGYDYNQMMYELSLDDPRLFLPVPVYRVPGDPPTHRTRDALPEDGSPEPSLRLPGEIAFFAPDRPRAGTVPVREVGGASPRLVAGEAERPEPVRFYCAPNESPPPATVPLYEQVDASGRHTYTLGAPSEAAAILCHVWPAPVDFESSGGCQGAIAIATRPRPRARPRAARSAAASASRPSADAGG